MQSIDIMIYKMKTRVKSAREETANEGGGVEERDGSHTYTNTYMHMHARKHAHYLNNCVRNGCSSGE